MANDYLAIADHIADQFGLAHSELVELREAAPLVAALPSIESSDGITHKYTKRTQNPVTGFRAENNGREFDHSIDTLVSRTLKILDWSFQVDKAVADAWRAGGASALLAREGLTHIASALFKYEQQIIRGTNADANGFEGFEDSAFLDGLADEMVISAGGTTADTGSSVYLIRASQTEVATVYKGDGFELGETIVQSVAGATGFYPAYYTPGCGWFASQEGHKYSVVRICNITEDAGATLTDDLIYEAANLFPAGMGPTHCVMGRRSRKQLRESRTATNATGAPAPMPTVVGDGIPVIVTDAIVATEALLT